MIQRINQIVATGQAAGDVIVHIRHQHRPDGSDAGHMFDFSGAVQELGVQSPLMIVDRGSILLIVYSAFSAGMVQGIWHMMSPAGIIGLVLLCAALLALALGRSKWAQEW